MKIGMTEKKHGGRLHKTGRKKCSGNRKIPEWLIKKTASSIRKTQKIPEKNRDDGGKTRQEPAQD